MIQKDLQKLQNLWNYHQCASSSYKSPHRMWIEGQIRRPLDTLPPVNEPIEDDYAIDYSIQPIELVEMEETEEDAVEGIENNDVEEDVEVFRPPLSELSLQWLFETRVPTEALEDVQEAVAAYASLRAALLVLIEEQDLVGRTAGAVG
jgi:hypothetical protein